jgi:hypothetical protein
MKIMVFLMFIISIDGLTNKFLARAKFLEVLHFCLFTQGG